MYLGSIYGTDKCQLNFLSTIIDRYHWVSIDVNADVTRIAMRAEWDIIQRYNFKMEAGVAQSV